MKLQIEGAQLRFRLSEAELAHLLDGQTVLNQTPLPDGACARRTLRLIDADTATLRWQGADLNLTLPRTAVAAYAATLPRRDALGFVLGDSAAALQIDFEVDVRDSVRSRLPPKAPRADAS
jgi:hypothetical protein